MAKSWDYAKLSKAAKEAGGPEKLVEQIASISKAEGQIDGIKKTTPWISVAVLGTWLITELVNYFKQKRKENHVALETAKQELIDGINEYDATHQNEEDAVEEREKY